MLRKVADAGAKVEQGCFASSGFLLAKGEPYKTREENKPRKEKVSLKSIGLLYETERGRSPSARRLEKKGQNGRKKRSDETFPRKGNLRLGLLGGGEGVAVFRRKSGDQPCRDGKNADARLMCRNVEGPFSTLTAGKRRVDCYRRGRKRERPQAQ